MFRTKTRLMKWMLAGAVAAGSMIGLVSASQSAADLSPLQTVIRGQSEWLAGGPA